jgi:hypothetical protein
MLTVRNSFLLLHTSDIAQLACSTDIISVAKTRLGVKVAMHPGFLRAGWQPGTLSLKSGMARPAVSVSSTGGTAGSLTELCNSATLI